jgi:UDP:flavonoid glycosyltransferase YjiC (YdhE family)
MEGVFGPFVPLGRALLAAGHDLLMATGPDLQARVHEQGFPVAVAGPSAMDGAVEAMADPAVVAAPVDEPWHFGAAMFGAVIAPAKLPALEQLAEQFRPDLVVHAPVDLAGPLLAAKRGIRSATYGFAQPLEPQLIAAFGHRVAPLWQAAGLEPEPAGGIHRDTYLDPCPRSLQETDRPRAPRVLAIRPEVPGDPGAALPSWTSTLGGRPVVYLSLGTVPFFNQPATFVTLLDELARQPVDVVVTVSDLNDPAALGPQPANVHIERWLPLAPLLPLCDAVVCHGGSGTTLAGLCAGLPLVVVPRGADQRTNAAACLRAGVARVLDDAPLSSTAVCEATMAVLGPDSAERRAASRVAAEITSMATAADVVHALDELVLGTRSGR